MSSLTNSTEVSEASSSNALLVVVVTYGSITLVLLLFYSIVKDRFKRLYNVRNSVPRLNCELAKHHYGNFSWISGVYKVTDDEIFDQCGFTAIAFIRMLRIGTKLSALGCFIAVWLVPTYYFAPNERVLEDGTIVPLSNANVTDPLDRMSLGHLYNNDPRLIGSVIASYLLSATAMVLIYREFSWFVAERHAYISRQTPQNYTVYFSRIPSRLRSKTALGDFFRVLFGEDSVLEIHFVRRIEELQRLYAQRQAMRAKLAHARASEALRQRRPWHASLSKRGIVDAISHFEQQLATLNAKIKHASTALYVGWDLHERRVAKGDRAALAQPPANVLDAAFVTFRNLRSTTTALQTLHHATPYCLFAREAPRPEDVFWTNTGMSHWRLTLQKTLAWVLTYGTLILWTVPVAFVATFQKVEDLKRLGPEGCEAEGSCPLMRAAERVWQMDLLLAMVAPLALIILNALLPVILGWYSTLEGHIGADALQASIFEKLTLFMIIQTFFVSALAGSIVSDVDSLIADPVGQIQGVLAKNLPTQAVTFMSLVFVKASLGLMAELLRVWPALFALIRWLLAPNLTEEEKTQNYWGLPPLSNPGSLWYAWYFSDVVLMFVVLFVYAVLSPLTSFFLLPIFVLLNVVYRNQLIFVYDPTHDGGGKYWTPFIWYVVLSMLIAQLTVLAVLSLNESTLAPLMIPLIVVSVLFWRYLTQQHFRVAQNLPLIECLARDAERDAEDQSFDFVRGKYKQEALVLLNEVDDQVLGDGPRTPGGAAAYPSRKDAFNFKFQRNGGSSGAAGVAPSAQRSQSDGRSREDEGGSRRPGRLPVSLGGPVPALQVDSESDEANSHSEYGPAVRDPASADAQGSSELEQRGPGAAASDVVATSPRPRAPVVQLELVHVIARAGEPHWQPQAEPRPNSEPGRGGHGHGGPDSDSEITRARAVPVTLAPGAPGGGNLQEAASLRAASASVRPRADHDHHDDGPGPSPAPASSSSHPSHAASGGHHDDGPGPGPLAGAGLPVTRRPPAPQAQIPVTPMRSAAGSGSGEAGSGALDGSPRAQLFIGAA